MFCVSCGKRLEPGMKFCPACGAVVDPSAQTGTSSGTGSYSAASSAGSPPPSGGYAGPVRPVPMMRPRQGRVIAGVCAAFALRYGWDVVVVRVLTALFLLFSVGVVAVAYLIAWIVIPEAPFALPTSSR